MGMMMVGETALVTAVKPNSDAEAKGLKPGDTVLAIDGFRPSRENMWKMYHRYYALMPASAIKLTVQSPEETQPRQIQVQASIERRANVAQWDQVFVRGQRERWYTYHDRFVEVGKDLLIWQMPTFSVPEEHVDSAMTKAQKFKTLIIDLRGNSGGYVKTLERLAGSFFDHEQKIADLKGRKEMKPVAAKPHGEQFKGQLIVLVDSESASAAELFARTIQLQKRGTVIGDRTAGAVMTSRVFEHQSGVGTVLYFGNSIAIADMIMPDGASLERLGVQPDELVLPTGADIAATRDPVLTRAAALAEVRLDPEKAGSLFPKDWRIK